MNITVLLTFVLIDLPASYCHNAIGGVREWTGVYVFYQIVEQESWKKGQLLCSHSRSWTNNHAYRVEKVLFFLHGAFWYQ